MSAHRNRLASETSPYLLQHAGNPVDWYPWGNEALERARTENKPIFLSIGYAACHWCHVMERESFENPAIAELINQNFVAIKVDREERPDLDDIYMAATVAVSGSGGWPMTVFLTPDREPFFAGTYFPPTDRHGRAGFPSLLKQIAALWKSERPSLFEQARQITEHIRSQAQTAPPAALRAESSTRATAQFAQTFDPKFGGFGSAPKFPPHQGLRLLLREYRRSDDAHALSMARATLDGMKNGGIYDHVGGGFARYSTDERWLVPHFEKMLYDNAQLAVVYLEAFQVTGDAEYQRVAVETLDYVLREMQGPEGGYFSATDADSEGEEGKFFVFLPEDIDDILGRDEAEAFCLYYDITVGGNWEGKNVLNTPLPLERVAEDLGVSADALRAQLTRSREAVYAARKQRVPPLLDDKVLAAWNGLMIEAMAEGYRVLRDPRYLDSAKRAAEFVCEHLKRPDGGLYRTARGGFAHIPAFLQDYAYVSDAFISLYEASGERRWLDQALLFGERILREFAEESGAFFNTQDDPSALIARVREGHDGALPSENAVAARALARLGYHLDRPELIARAEAALTPYAAAIERAPRAFATTLLTLEFLLEGPTELVIAGTPGAADTEALARAVASVFLPNRLVALAAPDAPNDTPLTRAKTPVAGKAALYICRQFACEAPITDATTVRAALRTARQNHDLRPELVPSVAT
ncbi:MAG TPA: thioredoxin domain-containing protein [Polyangiaceae bacterium]|nr:thioredoxin domain-containing protein [Polyangiaceae bacterium]